MAPVDLSVVEQRYRAVLAVERGEAQDDGGPVRGLAANFAYLLTRNARDGLAGLIDHTHRPESCPHQACAKVETGVYELRREHAW